MKYTISIEQYSVGWYWTVSDGVAEYNGYSITKRGAIWSANRMAKRWAKDTLNELTKESWQVEL